MPGCIAAAITHTAAQAAERHSNRWRICFSWEVRQAQAAHGESAPVKRFFSAAKEKQRTGFHRKQEFRAFSMHAHRHAAQKMQGECQQCSRLLSRPASPCRETGAVKRFFSAQFKPNRCTMKPARRKMLLFCTARYRENAPFPCISLKLKKRHFHDCGEISFFLNF